MTEPIIHPEHYEPIEPDWKKMFYSLALKVVKIHLYLTLGMLSQAVTLASEANKMITAVDDTPILWRRDIE